MCYRSWISMNTTYIHTTHIHSRKSNAEAISFMHSCRGPHSWVDAHFSSYVLYMRSLVETLEDISTEMSLHDSTWSEMSLHDSTFTTFNWNVSTWLYSQLVIQLHDSTWSEMSLHDSTFNWNASTWLYIHYQLTVESCRDISLHVESCNWITSWL